MGVSFYLLSAFLGCLIMLLLCVSEQKMDSDCEVKGTSAVYGKLGNGEDHGDAVLISLDALRMSEPNGGASRVHALKLNSQILPVVSLLVFGSRVFPSPDKLRVPWWLLSCCLVSFALSL